MVVFFKKKKKTSHIEGLFILKIKRTLFLLEKRESEIKKKIKFYTKCAKRCEMIWNKSIELRIRGFYETELKSLEHTIKMIRDLIANIENFI